MKQLTLFFRLWLQFGFRQLRTHAWRAGAVLLGIALGAAVFTSVRLAIDASLGSFTKSMDSLTGRADLVLVNPGGRVPERFVSDLIRQEAVKAASPILTAYVRPAAQNNASAAKEAAAPFLLIGFDPILDRPFRSREALESGGPSRSAWLGLIGKPNTLLVGQKLFERLKTGPDGRILLNYMQYTESFRIIGRLAPKGVALAEGGDIALTDISTFQEFTGIRGFVDRIDILLRPGATAADIEKIRAILPEGLRLEQPSEAKESGKLMIRAYQLNLSVLSFVSLFVGMFLVYSLVALHASSRRHELAVLLSIGASPRLLFLLFLAEGAFFGALGWVLAIPVSSFMVRRLLGLISTTISHLFVRVQVDRLSLDPLEVALSFVLTVFVSVLAAVQPAREAMRVSPREALLVHDERLKPPDSTRRLALLGFFLILLVWPLSRLNGSNGVPLWGYIATFFLFCGSSLLSPWLLRRIGSFAPPLLRRIGGQTAYLGGRYVRDAGTRIAVSVGALITAIALFVALTIMVHSFRQTVKAWVDQTLSGDLFLRPKMADFNNYRDPIPRKIVRELKSLGKRVDLLPYRRIFLRYGKYPYQFEAIDFNTFAKHAKFLLIKGKMEDILPELRAGRGVLVSEVFSNRTGLKPGERFHALIEGAEFDLPILGIFRDYRTQGGVVNYSLSSFEERTGDGSWSGLRIHFNDPGLKDRDGAARLLKEEILRNAGGEENALEITLGTDLRREVMRIFDETFAITTVLLLIALLVAALGITTTLTVLVLERSRQIHTLIATGASEGQVRAMIFWEAVLMVLSGEFVGLGCGFILSYLLIFVINRQSFGWTFLYSVNWPSLAASLPLILTTALLAALPACQLVLRRSAALALREQ